MSLPLYKKISDELTDLKSRSTLRSLPLQGNSSMSEIDFDRQTMINLSSNDYLGLASDKTILQEFYNQMNNDNLISYYGLGSTSSRLLVGNHPGYTKLEDKLSSLFTEAGGIDKKALIFNSGYHANTGILPALCSKNDLILSDKLNHASIMDGIQLASAKFIRFRHKDYEHLENLLKKNQNSYNNIFIVSESIFSMDGDRGDIKKLVQLKEKYKALLYIDEAHAFGLFGETGLGIVEKDGLINQVDIIMGTFGKSFGSIGAFSITNQLIKEWLINKMRPFIFTTALPPIVVNWNLFVTNKLKSLKPVRTSLQKNSNKLREILTQNKIKTGGDSQIIPVLLGENRFAVEAAKKMQEQGFLLFPIRPPTVPPNTARLRISLTALISENQIEEISEKIVETVKFIKSM